MSFSPIKKTAAYQSLMRDLSGAGLNHAYLTVSEDGEARKDLFIQIALNVFCPSSCGQCPACKQILSGNHLNARFVDGRSKLKVKDMENIVDDIGIMPVNDSRKLYFIDNAQLLDPRVQNKFLKTYEEPPSYATVFLGASNEAGLLSTVKSRAKTLYIEPYGSSDIFASITALGYSAEIAELAAAYSMGNLEKALRFSSDEKYKTLYEQTFVVLASIKNSSQVADYLFNDIFSKENISVTLDFLEIFITDILKISTGGVLKKYTVNKDYDLNRLAKGFTPAGAAMALSAINEGRKKLAFNVNSVSVAEKILFDILEARYKWQQ